MYEKRRKGKGRGRGREEAFEGSGGYTGLRKGGKE